MIRLRNVHKSFHHRAVLTGVNLDIPPGRVTLLLGDNGAGKTTLLRCLVGLSRPDRGEISLNGIDLAREPLAALRQTAFMPQAPQFNPRLKVDQVLAFYAALRGQTTEAVERVLEEWGIASHRRVTTARLSGGLRQRLALAIYSLGPMPLLVLDEPGLSLDPIWRERLQKHLAARARDGATVLVATHLLGEWEGKVDACVLLAAGRVSGALPPDRLRESFPSFERVSAS
jgi:ABC-type multidrug transport system ATPase subunit